MTPAKRPSRYVLAAAAIAGVGLLQVVEILAILGGNPPEGMDPCSLDLFGMRFPSNGDGCYIPVGVPAAFATATILFGVAFALRPQRLAPVAFPIAAVATLVSVPGVASQFDVFTTTTFEAALLGAATFLVAAPVGPKGSPVRRLWIGAIAGCIVLGVLDFMFSGFLYAIKPMPQVSFFIVAAAIAGAGLLAARLEPRAAA